MHSMLRGLLVLLLLAAVLPWSAAADDANEISLKVLWARPFHTDAPGVTVRFDPASREKLAGFTRTNTGRTLEVEFRGKVLLRAKLREPVLGEVLGLSGIASASEAVAIAEQLSSGSAPLIVRAVD
jgi:preprotein translocase subunit SecD